MKNKIGFVVIVALAVVLAFGMVYAASDKAVEHSKACDHASDNGKNQSSEDSVLESCEQVLPPPQP